MKHCDIFTQTMIIKERGENHKVKNNLNIPLTFALIVDCMFTQINCQYIEYPYRKKNTKLFWDFNNIYITLKKQSQCIFQVTLVDKNFNRLKILLQVFNFVNFGQNSETRA